MLVSKKITNSKSIKEIIVKKKNIFAINTYIMIY